MGASYRFIVRNIRAWHDCSVFAQRRARRGSVVTNCESCDSTLNIISVSLRENVKSKCHSYHLRANKFSIALVAVAISSVMLSDMSSSVPLAP